MIITHYNIEICGILDSVLGQNHEEKVIKILDEIDVSVSANDIEACHCMASSVNNLRRIIVWFTNRKFAKKALLNRNKLQQISSTSSPNCKIFVNENLTLRNLCWKLKHTDHI